MKLFAPKYYSEFACIKGDCRNSCCVGWEIEVDPETVEKYRNLPNASHDKILPKLDISDTRTVIITDEGGKCPFLSELGLCDIISELGEEYISVICRRHPRFYNFFPDRVEVGLGLVCEEACRIILTSDCYDELVPIGELDGEEGGAAFDTYVERNRLFDIISNRSTDYHERISHIMDEYGISDEIISTALMGIKDSLELLDESHRSLFAIGGNAYGKSEHLYLERFLAYLLYRHIPMSESHENMRARVGFAIMLAEIFENALSVMNGAPEKDIFNIARKISEEIEYSEDNTSTLIFEIEALI